jgi:hypothetical protein
MDNRVCVARPKIERLSAGQEQEAVTLLADAAHKDDAQPGGIPAAGLGISKRDESLAGTWAKLLCAQTMR